VDTVPFAIDAEFDNKVMLAFYMSKVLPFRDDNELYLYAASSGRSKVSLGRCDRQHFLQQKFSWK
jgi:hypothetical protein